MDDGNLGRLEKAVLYFQSNSNNGKNRINNGKSFFSEKIATLGYNLRERGKISKHVAGALVSFHHATLGPGAQKELAELWGVGPAYFTKWHTTFWYALSHVYEHGPIFGTSFLVDLATGINEGNYFAAANWIAGTAQNIVRFFGSWIFNKPLPVASLVAAPMQVNYYREEIKNKINTKVTEIKQDYYDLMSE